MLSLPKYFAAASITLSCLFIANNTIASEGQMHGLYDPLLQAELSKALRSNQRWRTLIDRKKLSLCMIDMQTEQAKFASVNGGRMMYAASLPKIAILLAAYVSFEDGSLEETDAIKSDLAKMIRVSSNSAATRMIDKVGFKKIQSVLQDPKFGFYSKDSGGGLWVGKRYASKGVRHGDPLYNISHGATADQVCRFYYLLSVGELINPQRSAQMLKDLGNPKLHHKFVSQVDRLAPNAAVYRKSGSWRRWHSDSIYVKGLQWRNYILVALVESENGEKIIRQLLPTIEGLMAPKLDQQ